MSKLIDIVGKRFGRLSVIERDGIYISPSGYKHTTWKCLCDCGNTKSFTKANLSTGNTNSCGCLQRELTATRMTNNRRERNPNWKGGRTVSPDGYVLVVSHGHPRAKKPAYRVPEHVLVMEKHIGRHLLCHENVHHKNGVRDDNRIENLELWSTYQPSGQRAEDKLRWAREIIELYGQLNAG